MEQRERQILLHKMVNFVLFGSLLILLVWSWIATGRTQPATGQAIPAEHAVFICPQISYERYIPPTQHMAILYVKFMTPEKASEYCGGNAHGCQFEDEDGVTEIVVARPADFNDVCAQANLGHEVLHALGADHESVRH